MIFLKSILYLKIHIFINLQKKSIKIYFARNLYEITYLTKEYVNKYKIHPDEIFFLFSIQKFHPDEIFI